MATAHVRASVVSESGSVLGRGSHRLAPVTYPSPERAEQDAASWWPATCSAVAEALRDAARGPVRKVRVVAVSVCGTSGTVVPVDSDGHPIAPAIMYGDQRSSDQAAEARSSPDCHWERIGLVPQATFGYPKLRWLASRGALAPGWSLCHVPDVVNWALAGRRTPTDWSHALKTGYDPVAGEWLCQWPSPHEGGCVPPPVLPPGSLAGVVCASAAEQSGLPSGCEIRLGMTDSCAAQIACGAARPGSYVSVLGTTLVLKGATPTVISDPTGAIYCHRHPDGWWLPGGASNTGGEAVGSLGAARLAQMDAAALAMGPASVVQYPLRRQGERFPFAEPAARGFVTGEPRDAVDAHRSALEGVAFVERLGYERIAALGGPAPVRVLSAGGGGRSEPWLRIRATVLGRDIEVPLHSDTAYGAALLAAGGSLYGTVTAASEAMLGGSRTVCGVRSDQPALDESYHRFVASLAERGWISRSVPGGPRRPPWAA